MRRRTPRASIAALFGLVGCVAGGRPPGPVTSPTGIVYPIGTPPEETRTSQTATLYLRQDRYDRALELALEGVATDGGNPIHYFLAGAAYARLADLAHADSMFDEATRLYPAYELEIEPEREAAWGAAFNDGLEAYEAGDVEGAIDVWREATLIYDLRPEVHRNLASLLALEARHAEAIDVYRRGLSGLEARPATRVLTELELGERVAATREMDAQLSTLMLATDRFTEAEPLIRRRLERDPDNVELRSDLARALSGMGRDAEAEEIYGTLLVEEGLAGTQLFNLGVALFRSSDFAGAAEAFRRLTESQPESRDAWFNYANALFAAEAWEALAAAGDRLIAVEPLGENAILITARAQLETGDRAAAVGTLALADAAPVYLDDLRMRRARATTRVEGRVTGNAADPGTSVRVRFVFYGERGEELGSETLRLAAPSPGEAAPFEVTFVMRADAYRYELVG